MSNSPDRSIPRRTFLGGAASLIGAAALGLPQSTAGATAPPASSLSIAVMYWNGASLVPAASLSSGDLTLSSVQLTFHGYGSAAEIRSINLLPLIRTLKGTQQGN